MTDDLVKRLRDLSRVFRRHDDDVEDLTRDDYLSAQIYPDEAADRIEALTARAEAAEAELDKYNRWATDAVDVVRAANAVIERLRKALAIAGPIALRDFENHPFILSDREKQQVAAIRDGLDTLKGQQP